MTTTLDEIHAQLKEILEILDKKIDGIVLTPDQIATLQGLSDIDTRLGLIESGEFRSGNGQIPGDGFSGGRFGYPGFTYGNSQYFLAGVLSDVLQIGLSLTNGKLYALAGAFQLGQDGIVATLLGDIIRQIADNGTTYRQGRLGMFTLPGLSAPSFGLNYRDNATATELVTNGDFATGDFTGWTDLNGGTWTIEDGWAKGTAAGQYKYQIIDVTGGSTFLLSYRAYNTASGLANPGTVYVIWYASVDGTGSSMRTDGFAFTNTAPANFLQTLQKPTGAQSVKLMIMGASSAYALYDDVSLTVVTMANYLGFGPTNGDLISKVEDGAPGQVLTGARQLFRQAVTSAAVQTSSGSVDVGAHSYVVTYYDGYGETDANLSTAVTATATAADQRVNLVFPKGPYGTTGRKIWRTKVGGASGDPTAYYLVTTIANNTATTYADTVADSTLTDNSLPTINTTGSRAAYPLVPVVWGDEIKARMTSNYGRFIVAGQAYGYVQRANTVGDVDDGDEFLASIWCEAGTYTLWHLGQTSTNRGKCSYYLDGVLLTGNVSVLDWYSSPAAINVEQAIEGVIVPTSGYHTLMIKVNGKNASSSDYMLDFTKIWFMPATY